MKNFLFLCIVFLSSLDCASGQSIGFAPSTYTMGTVNFPTAPILVRVRLFPPREIAILVSGFSCAPVTYTWTYLPALSSVVFVGTPDPVVNSFGPTTPNSTIEINGPGTYIFELCASACGGAQTTCSRLTIVAPPAVNNTPEISIDNPAAYTLPIAPATFLGGTIHDPTDRVTMHWEQDAGNPMPINVGIDTIYARGTVINRRTGLNISAINKAGSYSYTLIGIDERGQPNSTGSAVRTIIVKPATSTLAIAITPPGSPPDPLVLFRPVTNLPLNAQISGINTFNDKIKYTWTQVAGATPITLPASAYTTLGQATFATNLNLNALAYGTYTFRLRAEDEYYVGTFVEQDITFTVKPPETALNLSITPNTETVITTTPEGLILEAGKPPVANFEIVGSLTGVNPSTDQVRTYWRIEPATFTNSSETTLPTLPFMVASPKVLPLGTSSDSQTIQLTNTNISAGEFTFWFVARDVFYKKEDSVSVKIIIKKPVSIEPLQAFTPNGDGQNDVWTIKNIESFPDVGVRIVNDRGELVFETISVAKLPEKAWNGIRRDGKFASDGAYYYEFFDNRDQTKLNVGSFLILR